MQKQQTNRSEIYQSMEDDEIGFVLSRPDMYVGTLRQKKLVKYVAHETDTGFQIKPEEIIIAEAFAKVFMEVISNAADNVPRSIKNKTPCTKIKVDFNFETGETSVWNDGRCIPIEKRKDGRYIHTMIFGHFRTGENYNDSEEREGIGRNGLGVKLCNIFSKKFTVEGVDPDQGKKFSQTWMDNMRKPLTPKITESKLKSGYTCIRWIPDFKRFGMNGYTDDVVSLLYKYVIDIAMTTRVPVFLNGEKIPISNLLDYAEMYLNEETEEVMHIHSKTHEIVLLPNEEGEHRSISFVNGAYTPNDGIHVDAWSEAIFRPIVDKINKKNSSVKQGKSVATRPQINIKDVKQFFYLFVSVIIPNPDFESQSKTKLEGPEVTASFPQTKINEVMKWSTTDMIEDVINSREISQLKKSTTKKRGYVKVDKLDSANNEGGKKSSECILIICEGDSAKTYATTGIEIGAYGKKGRDWFGIYPLRGKILNVRKANVKKIVENKVITDLINALGLRYGVDYTDDKEFKTLRYGMLMTLTDADVDGLHILGLSLNCIHTLFPSLFQRERPFVVHMGTPIAKIPKLNNRVFFDEREYNEFMTANDHKYTAKYYKGLGTSSRTEVKETFGQKLIEFVHDSDMDSDMVKVFHNEKGLSDKRKKWLADYDPTGYKQFDNGKGISELRVSDFLNHYMIQFSIADCERNIPGLMDGLKESQRKVLYGCFKRNLKSDIKVAQLQGYISEHTKYHHGETSLQDTIIGMAACYTGGNNLPLLVRSGEMGCLDPNTEILMYDGTIRKACDIKVDDLLVGDDGEKRRVLRLTHGIDNMYKIIQTGGRDYIVNSQHILTLRCSGHKSIIWKNSTKSWVLRYFDTTSNTLKQRIERATFQDKEESYKKLCQFAETINDDDIFDIKLEDYLNMNKTTKQHLNAVYNNVSIQWDRQDVPINPYIFGVWLGGGTHKGMKFSNMNSDTEEILKKLGLYKNKHVTDVYMYNDKNTRLNVLAGFVDTVGCVRKQNNTYRIEIFQSYDNIWILESMEYISKSLGFRTTLRKNHLGYTLHIYGNGLYKIPTKLPRKHIPKYATKLSKCNISVESIGKGSFVGWQVDKNERFLLGDFTVTHNSRLLGGKDAASPRYVETHLEEITRLIFSKDDDCLLQQVIDDGEVVEPVFYVPCIPMVLANPCKAAIGTGWSSTIPGFNPLDLVECVKIWLDNDGCAGDEDGNSLFPDLIPWYRGFKGTIESVAPNKFMTHGVMERVDDDTVIVTELPIGLWTEEFQSMLQDMKGEKKIKGFRANHTVSEVHFEIDEIDKGIVCDEKSLKLSKPVSTSNLVLFNEEHRLQKFGSPDEIIDQFCRVKYDYMVKRKARLLKDWGHDLKLYQNRKRFVHEIIEKKLIIFQRDEDEVVEEMENKGYDKNDAEKEGQGYEYLLSMHMRSFTKNKIEQIQKEIDRLNKMIKDLKKTSEKQMWLNDLKAFENAYTKMLNKLEKELDVPITSKKTKKGGRVKK